MKDCSVPPAGEQAALTPNVLHPMCQSRQVLQHVDYSLTEIGEEAAVHVRGLADWVERRLPAIMAGRGAGC